VTVKAHSYLKRPDKKKKKKHHHPHPRPQPQPEPPTGPWNVPALCASYIWPEDLDSDAVIAIVELSGGWNAADVQQFCSANSVPVPTLTDVSVDGTKNSPGSEADGEVALDIQVAATAFSVATKGKPANIRMYWARDIASAVRAAAKDGCDVCSISWGADEANWGAAAGQDMEAAAQEALAAGMIVFAAAGDNDSSDGGPTPANVDLPAGCPSVVGCGGTSKTASSETVWNNNPGNADGSGTGGGYSTLFPAQAWQIGAPAAPAGLGRMVPDVAANADPDTGYNIVLDGQVQTVGGTSAVAPLYAGLFAAFGKKLGNVLPTLWQNESDFNDITVGDNGVYHAQVGPDPCTGLGSPIGTALAKQFVKQAAARARALSPAPVMSKLLAQAQDAIASTLAELPEWSSLKDAQTACAQALAELTSWPTS
jgi:kumamolisin